MAVQRAVKKADSLVQHLAAPSVVLRAGDSADQMVAPMVEPLADSTAA